jgi:hypothetical protein
VTVEPRTVARHALRAILAAQCPFWIVSAAVFPFRYGTGAAPLAVAALMAIDGVAFAVLALLAVRESRLVRWTTLLFLLANAVLTVTDQMGAWDWAVLAANLIGLAAAVTVLATGKRRRPGSAG